MFNSTKTEATEAKNNYVVVVDDAKTTKNRTNNGSRFWRKDIMSG